jgi:hypothetical protein
MNKRLAKLKNIQEANISFLNRNSKKTLTEQKDHDNPIMDEPDDSEENPFKKFFGFSSDDKNPKFDDDYNIGHKFDDDDEEPYDPGDRFPDYKSHDDYHTGF